MTDSRISRMMDDDDFFGRGPGDSGSRYSQWTDETYIQCFLDLCVEAGHYVANAFHGRDRISRDGTTELAEAAFLLMCKAIHRGYEPPAGHPANEWTVPWDRCVHCHRYAAPQANAIPGSNGDIWQKEGRCAQCGRSATDPADAARSTDVTVTLSQERMDRAYAEAVKEEQQEQGRQN